MQQKSLLSSLLIFHQEKKGKKKFNNIGGFGSISNIPNNTFCYEYTGGISLHYYEDRNYMIATPPESSIAVDEPQLPDTIDFSYYNLIHYEEK